MNDISDISMSYICNTTRECCDSPDCQTWCLNTLNRDYAMHKEVVEDYYTFLNAYLKLKETCNFEVFKFDDGYHLKIVEVYK